MVITRTIRMVARPTATMVRVGSRMGSLSALGPGTAGDIRITGAAITVATLMDDLRGAGLRDAALIDVVLVDMVRRFEAAKGAAPSEASAVGSVEDLAAAANKLIGSSDHRVIEVQRPLTLNDP